MSTRNIHVNIASYTLLVAGKKKYTGEEWDVLEFSSLTELKKYRKSHPEKMAFSYSYALSRGVDTQFRHINIAEPDVVSCWKAWPSRRAVLLSLTRAKNSP